MTRLKQKFSPGDAIHIGVGQENINDSDPCNKDNCMLSRAIIAWLVANYGGDPKRFGVKSTDHGVIFKLNGRLYVAVFDMRTAFRIYNYDQTFKKTRSKEAARKTVRPFKARIMIERTTAIKRGPPMSAETKEKLRKIRRKPKRPYEPTIRGSRRELSL